MSEIICITPTGDRPIPFELSRKWMSRQMVKPTKWIIVDDGKIPMEPWEYEDYEFYVRREPQPDDPKHTLVKNVETALLWVNRYINDTKIIFWEDDEYYSSEYIAEMSSRLDKTQVVGIGCAKYYHLPTGGYMLHSNMQHASLAQTAFHISVLPMVDECVAQGMEKDWLDCNIWRRVIKSKGAIHHDIFKDTKKLFVGMKGLPGRFGIGCGHKTSVYRMHDNPDRGILKEWIPDYYDVYLGLLEGAKV